MKCRTWMQQNQNSPTENSTENTTLLVPALAHIVPCQACRYNLVSTYPHTQVAVSYRPPLPEHHVTTHSLHLIVADSIPVKQQYPEQAEQ